MYSDLSPRQRESLFEAHASGYYQWSRDVSATQIADTLEHLRINAARTSPVRRAEDTEYRS